MGVCNPLLHQFQFEEWDLSMTNATYTDVRNRRIVERKMATLADVQDLLYEILEVDTGHGCPSLILANGDSELIVAQSRQVEKLFVQYKARSASYYVSFPDEVDDGCGDRLLEFDFGGSYTEIPENFWSDRKRAMELISRFLLNGKLDPDNEPLVREY